MDDFPIPDKTGSLEPDLLGNLERPGNLPLEIPGFVISISRLGHERELAAIELS